MVMPTLSLPTRSPSPKAFTRAEFIFLADNGFLNDGHYELVQGEIIYKMQNKPHSVSVMLFTEWIPLCWGCGHTRCQMPIDVSPEDNPTSLPEPDVIARATPVDVTPNDPPKPSDVELLIEVSDSTLAYDKTTKMGLYARAGIAEYWVADVVGRTTTAYHAPQGGIYADLREYGVADTIAPLAKPGASALVGDFFR